MIWYDHKWDQFCKSGEKDKGTTQERNNTGQNIASSKFSFLYNKEKKNNSKNAFKIVLL